MRDQYLKLLYSMKYIQDHGTFYVINSDDEYLPTLSARVNINLFFRTITFNKYDKKNGWDFGFYEIKLDWLECVQLRNHIKEVIRLQEIEERKEKDEIARKVLEVMKGET